MNSTYWIDRVMSIVYPTSASGFYIGLSSTAPNAAGGNVSEPSGNGYARVAVTAFTTPSGGSVKNAKEITFPRSTDSWFPAEKRATHWVLFDGTAGSAHVLSSGTLAEPIAIWNNTQIKIPANSLTITLKDMA